MTSAAGDALVASVRNESYLNARPSAMQQFPERPFLAGGLTVVPLTRMSVSAAENT